MKRTEGSGSKMDDLISRQAAIDALFCHADFIRDRNYANGEMLLYEDSAIEQIMQLPSAQKTGRWERHYTRPNVFAYWRCSSCGRKAKNKYAHWFYKYCPHCGARMESD